MISDRSIFLRPQRIHLPSKGDSCLRPQTGGPQVTTKEAKRTDYNQGTSWRNTESKRWHFNLSSQQHSKLLHWVHFSNHFTDRLRRTIHLHSVIRLVVNNNFGGYGRKKSRLVKQSPDAWISNRFIIHDFFWRTILLRRKRMFISCRKIFVTSTLRHYVDYKSRRRDCK